MNKSANNKKMSGEGRSNLFVRTQSEEEGGRISRTISLTSVQEETLLNNESSDNNGASVDDTSYSSLSVPSKSKSKKKGK